MSGFEIAGIVLGAFSIALEVLEKYRELEKRLKSYHHIRQECDACRFDLEFYQTSFTFHLRQLLLPLFDSSQRVNRLLSDPRDGGWKDQEIKTLIQKRLGSTPHDQIVGCIGRIQDALNNISRELALDSTIIQDCLKSSSNPTMRIPIEWSEVKKAAQFQRFRVKFSCGKIIRNELFDELKKYDDHLGRLLVMYGFGANVTQESSMATEKPPEDLDLCNSWIFATTIFKAITTSWARCCQDNYLGRLPLRHTGARNNEFHIVFAQQLPSYWQLNYTFITYNKSPSSQAIGISNNDFSTSSAMPISSGPIASSTIHPDQAGPISCICAALNQSYRGCYGYLATQNDRYCLHGFEQQQQQVDNIDGITIDELLREELPNRQDRFAISLTLASSFLQLFDTPWLPKSWMRSNVVFFNSKTSLTRLNQAHLRCELATDAAPQSSQHYPSSAITTDMCLDALCPSELLGIMLLELCFGKLLANRADRKQLSHGDGEIKKKNMFDLLAAKTWSYEVCGEAGPNFDEAIKWCLEGYRETRPDNWRQEMLKHVIQPLERCHRHLSEGR
ncbi:hypothetical protein F5B19DRAFT_476903 [Rostrohypoxylon terebratum]|nr:hypothetical protein F5B19DRAFT_476903 [Rostrohypoxylon terebratum]